MKIGVLAMQGAVAEHIRMLGRAGAEGIAVKRTEQLEELSGIIIPGGESTTIGKLMGEYGFKQALIEFSRQGKPIFGTCAGLIVIAKKIIGQDQAHLPLMNITVARNAFGRQRESFETELEIKGIDDKIRAVFIRAPLIEQVGPQVNVLATFNGQIVAAREGRLLVSSFHPELTDDHKLHSYFLKMVRDSIAGH